MTPLSQKKNEQDSLALFSHLLKVWHDFFVAVRKDQQSFAITNVSHHSRFHSRLRSCYNTVRIAPVLDNRAVLLSFDTLIMH